MGLLKPCLSVSESSGSVEIAVIATYDEQAARTVTPTNPGFDDLLGEPLFADTNDDSVGDRVRPEQIVEVKAKVKWSRNEEQRQDGTGNVPDSFLKLTVFEDNLKDLGLIVDGIVGIRPNDRLLRIQNGKGQIRHQFESGSRDGLHCFEVRPGETGSGVLFLFFENRQIVGS